MSNEPGQAHSSSLYVILGGKELGPLTRDQVLDMARQGQLLGETPAWKEGLADWKRLDQLVSLPAAQPEVPPMVPLSSPAKSASMDDGRKAVERTHEVATWLQRRFEGATLPRCEYCGSPRGSGELICSDCREFWAISTPTESLTGAKTGTLFWHLTFSAVLLGVAAYLEPNSLMPYWSWLALLAFDRPITTAGIIHLRQQTTLSNMGITPKSRGGFADFMLLAAFALLAFTAWNQAGWRGVVVGFLVRFGAGVILDGRLFALWAGGDMLGKTMPEFVTAQVNAFSFLWGSIMAVVLSTVWAAVFIWQSPEGQTLGFWILGLPLCAYLLGLLGAWKVLGSPPLPRK